MSHDPSPSAWTDQEKNVWIWKNVFGMHKVTKENERYVKDYCGDWNKFRAVELKVMEDDKLMTEYCHVLKMAMHTHFGTVKADLPTRVSALIAAHRSLHSTES